MKKPKARHVAKASAKPSDARHAAGATADQATDHMRSLAAERIAIEAVSPELDGGRFSAKSVAGESVEVEADIFCDGHDKIAAALLFRRKDAAEWAEAPMVFVDNDRWRGTFRPESVGRHEFTIIAWRDLFATCRDEISKKHAAGQPISQELREGRILLENALAEPSRAKGGDRLLWCSCRSCHYLPS